MCFLERMMCVVAMAVLAAGCAAPQNTATPTPAAVTREPVAPTATSAASLSPAAPTATADRWAELFERTPFPYTTPLPAPMAATLDGVYVKVEQIEGTPTPCRRCPDYKIEGGVWRLSFDNGIFRVYHTATGWRTLGSYTVEDDRLLLFNDPTCLREVGTYRWSLNNGALQLEPIEDTCAIRLRSRNLGNIAWSSCTPPNEEAAVTDHWKKPAGCG